MEKIITLDPITKKFTQVKPEEQVCYICPSNSFVDDHHYDLQYGRISEETVPLCRRCHKTIHMYGGINMFEDELLDKAIEVWNVTQFLLNRPLMARDKIVRSKYWLKKHGVKKAVTFDPVNKRFTQEGGFAEDNTKGSMTSAFPPFHFPHGEPLCGWSWVYAHQYDLLDYVPRIEIISPDLNLSVNINSKKKMGEVSKALRGLKIKRHEAREVITLDPETKRFVKEAV